MLTVNWKRVCKPREYGGLGLRRMQDMNLALLMKLYWNIQNSTDKAYAFLKAKYSMKNGDLIRYHKSSTIWPGVRWAAKFVKARTGWCIGNGKTIDFWRDNWNGQSIQNILDLKDVELANCSTKLGDLFVDGQWRLGQNLIIVLMLAGLSMDDMPKIVSSQEDRRVWIPDIKGVFSVANAFVAIVVNDNVKWWNKFVWRKCIHPKLAAGMWKIINNVIATHDNLKAKGICVISKCPLCEKAEETVDHLLWGCELVQATWLWITEIFGNAIALSSFNQAYGCYSYRSPLTQDLWATAVAAVCVELWRERNLLMYEEEIFSFVKLKNRIEKWIRRAAALSTKAFFNQVEDLMISRKLKISPTFMPQKGIKNCQWCLPVEGFVKINIDGASKGNPGQAGVGAVFRNHQGVILAAMAGRIEDSTSYIAECIAVVKGAEMAIRKGWEKLWIECDATAVVKAVGGNALPRSLHMRWQTVLQQMKHLIITSTWREVNMAADSMANYGVQLDINAFVEFLGKPDFLINFEEPGIIYHRIM